MFWLFLSKVVLLLSKSNFEIYFSDKSCSNPFFRSKKIKSILLIIDTNSLIISYVGSGTSKECCKVKKEVYDLLRKNFITWWPGSPKDNIFIFL